MLLVFLMVLLTCAGNVSGSATGRLGSCSTRRKMAKGKTLTAKYLAGAAAAVGLTILFQVASPGGHLISGRAIGVQSAGSRFGAAQAVSPIP